MRTASPGGHVVENSIERLLGLTEPTNDEVYSQFIALLADMVEGSLDQQKLIIEPKPNLDWKRWLNRHVTREEHRAMDQELTARLLGTDSFVRIA